MVLSSLSYITRSSVIILAWLLMASVAFAQESDTRARIYAQIKADPASAELTETEIEALVDALAMQAQQAQEATLVQDPTLTSETTFGTEGTGTEGSTSNTQGGTLPAVLLALVFVGAAVWLWQRHNRASAPPPQDTDSSEVL